MLSPGLSRLIFTHCRFGQLKSSAGLQHPLGHVWGLPWLAQWGEGHRGGAGAGRSRGGHVPAVGLLPLPRWCQPGEAPLLLAAVWSQDEALPVEKQATMAPSSPLSTFQVCPGAHLLGFGPVEQSRVRCFWGQVQLPAGRWHWLHQHFSAQPLQCQMWWFKPPVAEVSLTLHWNEVEERTCTAGSEMCPDQNRGRYVGSLAKAWGTSLGGM